MPGGSGQSSREFFPEGFLPFLARDNGSLEDPEVEEAVQAINDDLGRLLKLPAAEFWKVVANEPSLAQCLDSFLRFKRRAFDVNDNKHQPSAASQALSKRAFLVLLRMATVEGVKGAPSHEYQGDLLYNNWILDVPKLLDVAVLYGVENRNLTQQFLEQIFALQPKYYDDLTGIVPTLVSNLQEVELRCRNSLPETWEGKASALAGWPEALAYVQDVCVTFSIFLNLYPKAGPPLMQNAEFLLSILAKIHDMLLPELSRALAYLASGKRKNLSEKIKRDAEGMLEKANLSFALLQRFGFLLLKNGFLNPECSHDVDTDNEVSELRGEELMTVIMTAAMDERDVAKTFIHQVNVKYGLGALIVDRVDEGLIRIDNAQFDYLCMLIGRVRRPAHLMSSSSRPQREPVAEISQNISQNTSENDVDHAVLLSKISAIKDILNGYGDGFLAACLKEFGMDEQKVIHHLLDDSLPRSLAKLDRQMPLTHVRPDGEGPSGEAGPSTSFYNESQFPEDSQQLLPDDLGPGWFTEDHTEPAPSTSIRSWAQVSVAQSGTTVDKKTARMLNGLDNEVRKMVIRQANALLEYEDEYDDSFDDLAAGGADGLADIEGDDSKTQSNENTNKRSERGGGLVGIDGIAAVPQLNGVKRGKKGGKQKLWIHNGRIYNYAKEGARQVGSEEEARRVIQAEEAEIYGLGPGGNIPLNQGGSSDEDAEVNGNDHADHANPQGGGSSSGGQRGGRGRGQGRGRGGRGGQGRGRGGGGRSYGRKERNKKAVGNHHRKERALKKMA